jgi:hypothetical protein
MSFLRPEAPQSQQAPALTGMSFQTSAYGLAINVVYGTSRIAPNLIWYGDFVAFQVQNDPQGSGKGGMGGGGSGKSGQSPGATYNYQTGMALALCEGPIHDIPGTVWQSKAETDLASLGFSKFLGTYPQTPWANLSTIHSAESFGYNGIAYVAAAAYQLGATAQMPNHSFLVQGLMWDAALPNGDVDASRVIVDILSNTHYGVAFPPSRIAALTNYQSYVLAAGLLISPAFTAQATAAQAIDDLCMMTNSAAVWNASSLTIVPYGDEAVTGNGHTYTPPASPQYDLTDDDFITPQAGDDPVKIQRKRPADILNSIKIEVLDRNNQYNVAILEAKDQASIDTQGLKQGSTRQQHAICDLQVGRTSAQLQLQREMIANTYTFTLDARYVLLDPMDIVTLTDTVLGLDHLWVRIISIKENAQDGTLEFEAEEYSAGTGASAQYSFTPGSPFFANYGGDPGSINTPIIFEPDTTLSQGLEVWFAVSGGVDWGGAEVWVSADGGTTYGYAGQINGGARMGVTTNTLPAFPVAPGSQTIDQINTLSVDLAQSRAQILSTSQAGARAYNSLCYVGGEYIAYATAALTSGNAYDLTYLVRGTFNSFPVAHAGGTQFCRIDQGLFRWPYTVDRIGQTLHFKFVSFNLYRGGLQSLADVTDHPYTLTGVGLQKLQVAFDNLDAELRDFIGFQEQGAQIAADFAGNALDRAHFAQDYATASVSTESDARQTADNSLAFLINTVAAGLDGEVSARGLAISALQSSIDTTNGAVTVLSGQVTQINSKISDPSTGLSALASGQSTLATRVSTTEQGLAAQSVQLTSVSTQIGAVSQSVTTETSARQNFDGSMVGYWAVQMTQNSGNQARVSGARLISTTGATGAQITQMIFEVDKFMLAPPGGTPSFVFVPGTVNGNAYFGMHGQFVIDGTITAGKIAAGSISADKLVAGSITADKIAIGGVSVQNLIEGAFSTRSTSGTVAVSTSGNGALIAQQVVTIENSSRYIRAYLNLPNVASTGGQIGQSGPGTFVLRCLVDGVERSRQNYTHDSGTGGFTGAWQFTKVIQTFFEIPPLSVGGHTFQIFLDASGTTTSLPGGTFTIEELKR